MKIITSLFIASVLFAAGLSTGARAAAGPTPAFFNRARFYPAPGKEQALVGGKFTGSNVSAREGFEPLAEIAAAPAAGQWTELAFPNQKLFRWIRYEAPAGSYGNVAEVEFYSGPRKLNGPTFGSFGWRGLHNWPRACDGKTDTWFDSDVPDGQYVGMDVGELATAQMPRLEPPPGNGAPQGPVQVTLHCATPGAVTRYSFAGTPGPDEGVAYQGPLALEQRTTLFAVAYKPGVPPSPVAWGTYLAGSILQPGFHSMHVGNSLTASLLRFPDCARAAGFSHDFHSWLKNGGSTPNIWNNTQSTGKSVWDKELATLPSLEQFTVQPRLPGFTEADLANEAKYDALFFDAARAKSPQVQPWLYSEWPSRRPGFNGWPPPATNYAEACAALLRTTETIERKICETYQGAKQPRILPCTLAVAQFKARLAAGELPGFSADEFDEVMFYDNVHPGATGRYLLCLTWFAAFYAQSPVGKIPPVNTALTAEQAATLQQLAWDVVKNYPDCGLFEAGTVPCAKPEFVSDGKAITLQSATAGAWFRYTLDGTTPSRTNGFVYCGVISVQPGIKVKAVAYRSGMADSAVAELPAR